MSLQNLLINASAATVLISAMSGCASFLPYHEDFSCTKGAGEGTCSRVSENYEYAIRHGRKSTGESHVSGTYATAMTHHDDAYDKVIVIDSAVKE